VNSPPGYFVNMGSDDELTPTAPSALLFRAPSSAGGRRRTWPKHAPALEEDKARIPAPRDDARVDLEEIERELSALRASCGDQQPERRTWEGVPVSIAEQEWEYDPDRLTSMNKEEVEVLQNYNELRYTYDKASTEFLEGGTEGFRPLRLTAFGPSRSDDVLRKELASTPLPSSGGSTLQRSSSSTAPLRSSSSSSAAGNGVQPQGDKKVQKSVGVPGKASAADKTPEDRPKLFLKNLIPHTIGMDEAKQREVTVSSVSDTGKLEVKRLVIGKIFPRGAPGM
jgi:hypothetical protein